MVEYVVFYDIKESEFHGRRDRCDGSNPNEKT